jgi:ABC-type transport system substrate-binding protein
MEKKRILSLLTALVFCLSAMAGVFSAAAEAPAAEPDETTETSETPEEAAEEEIVYPDELQVGHTTVLKGDFFTEMFGNNTSDIDVRALIHGYNLVNWDQNQGTYLFDESVVETVQVADDEIGNRTYYLALYDDLYYSDGTPITAWDCPCIYLVGCTSDGEPALLTGLYYRLSFRPVY